MGAAGGWEGVGGALMPPPPSAPALYCQPAPPGLLLSFISSRCEGRTRCPVGAAVSGVGFALEDEQLVSLIPVAVRGSARGCAVGYGAGSPRTSWGMAAALCRAACDSPFPGVCTWQSLPSVFGWGEHLPFAFGDGAACACADPALSPGCQLGTGARSCVVEEDDDFLEHLVLLRTICLGADARDELHVVAVDSKNASGERRPVPIAALRSSLLPMISLNGLELVPPVTFVLQCGAGPVYLSGQRVTLDHDVMSEAHREELSEKDADDEDDDRAS
ncbi:uncharacterized protein LOC130262052 isoform X2 [Oenanthe melanoleuca]|uniref:uncharacterized protein LOC130262052 isoform X2 n=1 Tax=Oenanthe melanoleuca TaxID=2939378 RepID=UPI0024C16329|nr:uncharacterized protein LOC130262052 isoform X2 [Oenanthe melanoleuca]